MPQINRNTRKPASAAVVLVLLALALAACGGSSSSSSTSTASASSTTPNAGAFASRFAAVRECLQKQGITLPKRTPGQARPSGGGFFGGATGGPHLPAGVSRAQYEAAIKKCGGGFRGHFGGAGALASPAAKQALEKFAACLRENGVNVPAPNTSGKGPVFNTSGIDTSSAKFKAAQTKCSSAIHGLFGARPGAGAPGAPGSVPPAAG